MSTEDRACPRCGSHALRPVETANGTNLLCTVCHRCWYREHGYLIEVNRYACAGCEDRTLCRPI